MQTPVPPDEKNGASKLPSVYSKVNKQELSQKSPWIIALFSQPDNILVAGNYSLLRWYDPQKRAIPDGLSLFDLLGVEFKGAFEHMVLPHVMVFGSWEGECTLRDVWGSENPVHAAIFPVALDSGAKGLVLQACRRNNVSGSGRENLDAITDRELLHALLEAVPESVYFKDTKGRFLRVSSHHARKFGFQNPSMMIGKTDFDIVSMDQAQRAFEQEQNILATDTPILNQEDREEGPDGMDSWVLVSRLPLKDRDGKKIGTFGLSRDINARKRAEMERRAIEMQLQLSQKLESIGRLASGVAHEINTPAQFITDNTHFLKRVLAPLPSVIEAFRSLRDAVSKGEDSKAALERIAKMEKELRLDYILREIPQTLDDTLEGLGRVSQIVRSLKEFSHPNKATKAPMDLNRAINTTVALSRHEWKYVADMELVLDESIPTVYGIVDEVNQVVLNMIVNAAHAIEDAQKKKNDSGRGKITIRTSRDGEDFVLIEIRDTGCGIPLEVRDRIFDPFFTTKDVGKGTGQGLAIAHSIVVKNHSGSIHFETEVGQGTSFIIRLPLGQGERDALGAVNPAATSGGPATPS